MSLYETVFIARQDLTAEDVDALTSKFSKIITDANGKVHKEYWGLRNLAYKIKKNKFFQKQCNRINAGITINNIPFLYVF